jgi:hypothetical protein
MVPAIRAGGLYADETTSPMDPASPSLHEGVGKRELLAAQPREGRLAEMGRSPSASRRERGKRDDREEEGNGCW